MVVALTMALVQVALAATAAEAMLPQIAPLVQERQALQTLAAVLALVVIKALTA